jgi:hypothetical protein
MASAGGRTATATATATTTAEVPTRAEEFVAYIAVDKLPDHEQFPIAHIERAGHSMRSETTEQSCKSMNAANNKVRKMSPAHALLFFAIART